MKVATRHELSSIPLQHLDLEDDQRTQIRALYKENKIFEQTYRQTNNKDQLAAAAVLASYRLESSSMYSIGNKWKIQWSQKTGKGDGKVIRALYQW